MTLPWRIEQILSQMGGRGLHGALVYTGASMVGYNNREDDSKPDPSTVDDKGFVDFQTGLMFKVNGPRGKLWKIIVSFEPNDTYTVRLWQGLSLAQTGKIGEILFEFDDVYCDMLQSFIEEIYDTAIAKYNGGYICI